MRLRKNPGVDLDKKRKIFLEIGFIVTLLLVLAAFEYRSYEKNTVDLHYSKGENISEELPPVTMDKKLEAPPPINTTVIELVDNNIRELLVDPEIDVGFDEDERIPIYVPEKDKKDEEIPDDIPYVAIPGIKAQFPGGTGAFHQYLKKNLNYPDLAKKMGITGKVYVEFFVEKDGSVSGVLLKRGIGGGCDEEAIRVISNSPNWIPAQQQRQPVRTKLVLAINFVLGKS